MPVQANVSIYFTADSPEEAEAIVAEISGLPEGAQTSATISQTIAFGIVDAEGDLRTIEET